MIFNALKIVINGGNYDHEQTLSNMDFYLLKKRITQAQYNELEAMINAQQTA